MRDNMKSYFVVLILGLFVAGICFCLCPGNAIALPLPVEVAPSQGNRWSASRIIEPVRLKDVSSFPTTAFNESQMEAAVEATGDLLIASNPNIVDGWKFNLGTGTEVADNIWGVIGMGLLRAYNMTKEQDGAYITAGKPEYMTAAGKVADVLKGSSNPLLAPDCIFLYLYSDASGDAASATAANTALASKISGRSAAQLATDIDTNYVDQGRIWQLATWAEAFQFYDTNYADAIVDGIILNDYVTVGSGATKVGGFVYDSGNNYVRTLDQARMLDVLVNYYSAEYPNQIAEGLALLMDLQGRDPITDIGKNGYFRWGCQLNTGTNDVTLFPSVIVQDQAYAVRAMAFNAQTTWTNYDLRLGTYWAANALLHMHDTDMYGEFTGAYSTQDLSGNISEYNAEALLGLHASCREGDVDRSGRVIAGDALSALKAAVGMENLTGPALLNADRNGDGDISADDALQILQASVGKVVAVNQGSDIDLVLP